MKTRPVIGVTLDQEPPGGYSAYPWYALRTNYMQAIAAAGGLPIALPHNAALAEAFLDRIGCDTGAMQTRSRSCAS